MTEQQGTPLDGLRKARQAIQEEINEDYLLMKALTARVTAREDVLRHLDVAISLGEQWAIGRPPAPEPKRRGRKPGWDKPQLPAMLGAGTVSDNIPEAFRAEVAAALAGETR